jgi:hypothetical protein
VTSALIIDAVILAAVLEADLGGGRKVGLFRLLRPLLLAAGIVPLFIKPLVTHGHGLTFELVLTAVGVLLGLLASSLMHVSPRSSADAGAQTRAGFGYALLWIVVLGARAAFSYGSNHWFGGSLEHWQIHHQVTTAAITDGLVFEAVAMLLTRTGLLALRGKSSSWRSAHTGAPKLRGV